VTVKHKRTSLMTVTVDELPQSWGVLWCWCWWFVIKRSCKNRCICMRLSLC